MSSNETHREGSFEEVMETLSRLDEADAVRFAVDGNGSELVHCLDYSRLTGKIVQESQGLLLPWNTQHKIVQRMHYDVYEVAVSRSSPYQIHHQGTHRQRQVGFGSTN